jgi:retron-type reverse transcriptase
MLGVPTVADRVAQTVVARRLEAKVEAIFHPDSFGYRPGRAPQDAVEVCRRRCWRTDWVIDLDIQKFFDSVPRDLIIKAVAANTDVPWVVLYVRRWLDAPVQKPDGSVLERDRGTPQGSAVSPVLANLFLHYAFDLWMTREFPTVEFERYADLCRYRHKSAYLVSAGLVPVTSPARLPVWYRTPAASSSPCNAMFNNKGEITPPCGVPASVGESPFPASNIPAFNQPATIRRAGKSPMVLSK